MTSATRYLNIDSPIGNILLVEENEMLARLEFTGKSHALGPPAEGQEGSAFLDEVHRQLAAYFAGTRRVFDIPVFMNGTAFQKKVWRALSDIPFGAISNYSLLSEDIGRPQSVRAVGAANGLNPISIIVPCHRIIGKNGHLTGYAGGLEAKRWLLRHEGHQVLGVRTTEYGIRSKKR